MNEREEPGSGGANFSFAREPKKRAKGIRTPVVLKAKNCAVCLFVYHDHFIPSSVVDVVNKRCDAVLCRCYLSFVLLAILGVCFVDRGERRE